MKIFKLTIPESIQTQLFEHSQSITPIESCGYLAGTGSTITTFFPMTNIDNSPEHFSFDPKEQFKVVKDARQNKLELLAVYHSHPESPARLSEEDIKLFNDPNPVYLIVSLAAKTPVLNGFKVIKPTDNEIEIYKVDIIISKEVHV
jgi:[CysO sulfur-carrier protein]-S-L-cysteine hydrolase